MTRHGYLPVINHNLAEIRTRRVAQVTERPEGGSYLYTVEGEMYETELDPKTARESLFAVSPDSAIYYVTPIIGQTLAGDAPAFQPTLPDRRRAWEYRSGRIVWQEEPAVGAHPLALSASDAYEMATALLEFDRGTDADKARHILSNLSGLTESARQNAIAEAHVYATLALAEATQESR